jgi:hypothetical protein
MGVGFLEPVLFRGVNTDVAARVCLIDANVPVRFLRKSRVLIDGRWGDPDFQRPFGISLVLGWTVEDFEFINVGDFSE